MSKGLKYQVRDQTFRRENLYDIILKSFDKDHVYLVEKILVKQVSHVVGWCIFTGKSESDGGGLRWQVLEKLNHEQKFKE